MQVEKLRAEDPSLVDSCTAAAGLSLGEYTALTFAGALSFEDGLRLVKLRAEAMQVTFRVTSAHSECERVLIQPARLGGGGRARGARVTLPPSSKRRLSSGQRRAVCMHDTACMAQMCGLSQLRWPGLTSAGAAVHRRPRRSGSSRCVRSARPYVVQGANMGHQLAGGHSSWCPELESWTTSPLSSGSGHLQIGTFRALKRAAAPRNGCFYDVIAGDAHGRRTREGRAREALQRGKGDPCPPGRPPTSAADAKQCRFISCAVISSAVGALSKRTSSC